MRCIDCKGCFGIYKGTDGTDKGFCQRYGNNSNPYIVSCDWCFFTAAIYTSPYGWKPPELRGKQA
jgi:hypothetical protein